MNESVISRLMTIAIVLFLKAHFSVGQQNRMPIDTSFLLPVNGVQQYLEIKGALRSKPVLLFIHGGPFWPATPMLRRYNQDLTNDFVVVSWDQRNCGKSGTDASAKLTPDLFVEDAHQVTLFLKKKLAAKKILVVGNSWGSVVGIMLVTKYPQDYWAYVGVGQVVNQPKALQVVRDLTLKQAELKKDTATVRAIRQLHITPSNAYYLSFEDLMKFYQLAAPYIRSDAVMALEDMTQLYPDYHYSKIDWFTPLMTYGKELVDYMNSARLDISVYTKFEIPMYFIAGLYDYNTPSALVEEYFKTIAAPTKKFFWFESSGHSPQWEESKRFHECLLLIAAENKE
ncbi:MAG: alpha/beta fold hydrolase [Bacteroidota bacterium]